MANMKLLATLFALLQVLSLHAHLSQAAKPKPTCKHSGFLHGIAGNCNKEHDSVCCRKGKKYRQYSCSPPVSANTPAILTVNGFDQGEDGGGPSECDNQYHRDSELVVALSSGWLRLDGTHRCGKKVRITAQNGRSVLAKVVDECDSMNGCDAEHNFEPPCPYNVVDGSPAVWKALRLNETLGVVNVTWSDDVRA